MRTSLFRRPTWPHLALIFLAGGALLLAGPRRAAGNPGDPPADDGMPAGTLTFFTGGKCPPGWTFAASAAGRMVVGVNNGTQSGIQVGKPLGDQQDRTHAHSYTATLTLADKAIAGADGGNTQGAQAQDYLLPGTTTAHASGLPFVQVQACVKQ